MTQSETGEDGARQELSMQVTYYRTTSGSNSNPH